MKQSLFANLPDKLEKEVFEPLVRHQGLVIERILSKGHASPEGFWYDQEKNEFVLVVQGRAGIRFKDPESVVILEPGDYLVIPARSGHRVEWTAPDVETIWLAVHY
ncbi:homogentisate 1,2-dioxygenase [Desulfobotulus alkaliphilus]|uniref:Homogentisate 1,2-dioxygenase n=1 Tax=Desulfobotulus alkaliphilus TaxID=622671 RepID=A0A562RZA5_9BACT|nr:cupin domain-containing protein [Desulfobotulus alkaliphilus]TWI74203.1 homogentisate 1,2-dioxygenase [Desulfobotulus alkaliphilus]